MAPKATLILYSQGRNRDGYDRLARISALCALQSPYNIRDDRIAEDYAWHGLPARLGKAGTIVCEDLPMESAKYRHKDTHRRLKGWVKVVMVDTPTSTSRRQGSALAMVNPDYTSQIDFRTGLLQGRRRWDRLYSLDGVVLDADTNAACNNLVRMYYGEKTLDMPYRGAKALPAERTGTAVGAAPPALELRGFATPPPSTDSELP